MEREGIYLPEVIKSDNIKDLIWEVESIEDQGTWPEGHEAVIEDTVTGKKYLYTDKLEEIK